MKKNSSFFKVGVLNNQKPASQKLSKNITFKYVFEICLPIALEKPYAYTLFESSDVLLFRLKGSKA